MWPSCPPALILYLGHCYVDICFLATEDWGLQSDNVALQERLTSIACTEIALAPCSDNTHTKGAVRLINGAVHNQSDPERFNRERTASIP
jgi:hypothetical protein